MLTGRKPKLYGQGTNVREWTHVDDFFFNDTATPEIYTLSLHDALPISCPSGGSWRTAPPRWTAPRCTTAGQDTRQATARSRVTSATPTCLTSMARSATSATSQPGG